MALKALINNDEHDKMTAEWEKIPAEFRPEYEKLPDGSWRQKVVPVGELALRDITDLNKALEAERNNVKKLRADMAAFDGITDPVKAKEALGKVEQMSKWTPDDKVREQIEANKSQLVEAHRAELLKAEKRAEALMGHLQRRVVSDEARAAIAKHTKNADLLLPHILNGLKMVQDAQGNYLARVVASDGTELLSRTKTDGSYMGIEEYVLNFKEKFPEAFPTTVGKGGGATNQGGGGASNVNGVLHIKRGDHAAISQHQKELADGTAKVVD